MYPMHHRKWLLTRMPQKETDYGLWDGNELIEFIKPEWEREAKWLVLNFFHYTIVSSRSDDT